MLQGWSRQKENIFNHEATLSLIVWEVLSDAHLNVGDYGLQLATTFSFALMTAAGHGGDRSVVLPKPRLFREGPSVLLHCWKCCFAFCGSAWPIKDLKVLKPGIGPFGTTLR